MGGVRGTNSLLDVKHEVKRPSGRPRHRWKDCINVDLNEGVD
jgi:hypothetical protein